MSDAVDPTNPPAGGTGLPAPTPGIDWESNDNPYKKKFIGMQGAVQKLQGEKETFQSKAFDLDTSLKAVLGEKETLVLEKAALAEKHDTVAGELDVTKETLARLNVIIADYPDLLDFEKQGLLPDGTGEELKTKLGAFKIALSARGAAVATDLLKGATPPPPANASHAKSPADIKAEAFQAMREGRIADYEKAMDEYFKASAK